MNEQEVTTFWNVMPDFAGLWKEDADSNTSINIEGIYATITSYTIKRNGKTYLHYLAMIQLAWGNGWNLPYVLQHDVTSYTEARRWSESWLRHFYKMVQLEKQVEYYRQMDRHFEELRQMVSNMPGIDTTFSMNMLWVEKRNALLMKIDEQLRGNEGEKNA